MADRRVFLDQIKNQHDLRTEFPFSQDDGHGRHVRPKSGQGGRTMVGLCPFHTRVHGTPSLVANRTHYKCYGSCANEWWGQGDIFTLIQKAEGKNFLEAVEFLAGDNKYKFSNTSIVPFDFNAPLVALPPLEPLPSSTMDDFFDPLTKENAQVLLNMGFEYETLEWADIRTLWSTVYAWPVYEDGTLMNVKLYDPARPEWKWLPFFHDRRKQLYLIDDAAEMELRYVVGYESEKDSLLSRQWGVPSMATGGATVWFPKYTEKLLPFDLFLGVKDLDAAGEGWAVNIKKHMPRFIPIDWRLLRPGLPVGFDLGKYVKGGGNKEEYIEFLKAGKEGLFMYEDL